MRHARRAFEAADPPREDAQTPLLAVFVTILVQDLHAHANSEKEPIARDEPAQSLRQAALVECAHRRAEGSVAGHDDRPGRVDQRRVAADHEVRAAALQGGQQRAQIAAAKIDDDQRPGSTGYASMPFVEGTSSPPTTLAWANARAKALNEASHR